jgi:hypothetical protein
VDALSAANNNSIELTPRTSTAVAAADFHKADVIILAGVPELPDAAVEALEKRVRSGAGLAVFLGPHVKPAFYNDKLHRALQPTEGLLPLPLKNGPEVQVVSGNPGAPSNVRWGHPLLAPLRDPVQSDLTQARFHLYAALAGHPGKNDIVLARFDDDTPALLEHPLGAGRVILANTTADDAWSDLPRRASFVPLLDRLLSYLSAGGLQRSFTVGDAVVLPLAEWAGEEVNVVAPGGHKEQARLASVRGQTFLRLDEAPAAGIFRVERSGKEHLNFAFAVNASRGDSPLAGMDVKTLEQVWAPVPLEVLSADAAAQRFGEASSHWSLWPALVFLAGLLLIAETFYVYRLCPRVNPKVAESVVRQGGILKPLAEKS